MKILFWVSLFGILHTFVIYPITLYILNKFKNNTVEFNNNDSEKFVSIIIPAHNEEKVIEKKLDNLISLDYKKENLEIIIASDNSTDNTNNIVAKYITENNLGKLVKLYIVKERKGKTNAQNEAVRISKGDILVFSDANSILKENSIKELVKIFVDEKIGYVSGKLEYYNEEVTNSANSEKSYWNYDLFMRKMESNIDSITAGNGAIYAIRKSDYLDLEPILCHDSSMPIKMVIANKKAKYNENAIAYEKAGESSEDEFKRKVRMARQIISLTYSDLGKYNIFKHGYFSYFYFSHRYLRNSLFLLHLILYISNIVLINHGTIYNISFIGQTIIYLMAFMGFILRKNKISKILYIPFYYSMTLLAQLKGAINDITGKSKPIWEKAESTR